MRATLDAMAALAAPAAVASLTVLAAHFILAALTALVALAGRSLSTILINPELEPCRAGAGPWGEPGERG